MRFFAPFRRILGLWLTFFPFIYFTLQIFSPLPDAGRRSVTVDIVVLNNILYRATLYLTALRIRPIRTSFVTTSSVQLALCNKLTVQSIVPVERSPRECNSRSVGQHFSRLSLNPKFQEQVLDPTLSHSRSAHIEFEIIIHLRLCLPNGFFFLFPSGFTAKIFCASVFPIQCYLPHAPVSFSLCLSHTHICVCVYIYIYMCVCIYIYIYIYISQLLRISRALET